MDVRFSFLLSWFAVISVGCSAMNAPTADVAVCVLEPALLQRCDPPSLPTVQTFEQIDAAVTHAYACTNQLNAQLSEILRRCSADGREVRQALVLARDRPHGEFDH